jgi:hypothetical protein
MVESGKKIHKHIEAWFYSSDTIVFINLVSFSVFIEKQQKLEPNKRRILKRPSSPCAVLSAYDLPEIRLADFYFTVHWTGALTFS